MDDYQRMARAIVFVDQTCLQQPTLSDVASAIGLSEFHTQRLFRRWTGISPKRFLQFLTAKHARWLLQHARSVLDTSYEVGLSGPGRLHDLIINVYAATPAQLRSAGRGLTIRYGLTGTPLGPALLAYTDRGVCALSFVDEGEDDGAFAQLRCDWPAACLQRNDSAVRQLAEQIFAGEQVTLLLRGSNFQLRVWEALLRIPAGKVATYRDIAVAIGAPRAARAVGTALGNNPIALLIPCHRVLRACGGLGGYRWGLVRKRALLGRELGSNATVGPAKKA